MRALKHVWRFGVSILALVAASLTAFGATSCTNVLSLEKLMKEAYRFDSQVVCVRALLRSLRPQNKSFPFVHVFEAIPLDPKQGKLEIRRVGLLDWDEEFGVDEGLYRPESYDLLDRAARQCLSVSPNDITYDVQMRAVVEYKKALTERAYSALSPNLANELPPLEHHDVELVVLEIVRATAVCRK